MASLHHCDDSKMAAAGCCGVSDSSTFIHDASPDSRSSHRGPTVARHQHQACGENNGGRPDEEDSHQEGE